MPEKEVGTRTGDVETLSTAELIGNDGRWHKSQLHWRLSLPILTLIVALLAVPLSKTEPRQGRFAKLVPAILLYLAYLVLLTNARNLVAGDKAPVLLFWGIHLAFFALALFLLLPQRMKRWLRFKKPLAVTQGGSDA